MEAREAQEAMEASNQEVWKPVVGYEDSYAVSDHGNVRSLDRVDSRGHRVKGRTMKPWTTEDGYRRVRLSRGGEVKNRRIHRLVVEAFIGPIPEGMEIDHLNNLPGDNRLENLQVLTPKENNARKKLFGTSTADLVASGKHHHTRKIQCPRGHVHFEGNSVPSSAKRGRRECLVCHRARSYIWYHEIPKSQHWAVFDYQLERFLLEESENV